VEPRQSEKFAQAVAGRARTITAAVEVTCAPDGAPFTLFSSLKLEYKTSSQPNWELMNANQTYELPPYSLVVGSGCRVGDWRLRYEATGLDAAKVPISVDQAWPDVFVSTCP
jgi:hypothetical protein